MPVKTQRPRTCKLLRSEAAQPEMFQTGWDPPSGGHPLPAQYKRTPSVLPEPSKDYGGILSSRLLHLEREEERDRRRYGWHEGAEFATDAGDAVARKVWDDRDLLPRGLVPAFSFTGRNGAMARAMGQA